MLLGGSVFVCIAGLRGLHRFNGGSQIEIVATSLGSTAHGQECVAKIATATSAVQAQLTNASGLAALSKQFKTCKPVGQSTVEIANFMSSLASSFDGVVQYNDDNKEFEHPGGVRTHDRPHFLGWCVRVRARVCGSVYAHACW